jgi:hypothetical protein
MYIVIKTIKGRQYRYEQTSYRVGKKVRTKSRYLGPIGRMVRSTVEFVKRQGPLYRAGPDYEEELLKDVERRERAYASMVERFQEETGLKMSPDEPTPPASPSVGAPSPSGPSPDGQDPEGDESSDGATEGASSP